MILHQAVYDTYPDVVTFVSNLDGTYEAYGANGNIIIVDPDVVSSQTNIIQTEYRSKEYQRKRASEYPDFKDYLDGVVKGDQQQIQTYIDACLSVKQKYPKPL